MFPRLPAAGQQAVYLLHFDTPFEGHYSKDHPKRRQVAAHYCGYTAHSLERRLKEHEDGKGSALTRAIRRAGIGFTLAACWPGEGRPFEKRLKARHQLSDFCPICNPKGE